MKYTFSKSNPPRFEGVIVKQHKPGCTYPQTQNRKLCTCPKHLYINPGQLRISAKTDSWGEAEARGRAWVEEHDPNRKQVQTITPKPILEAFDDFIATRAAAGLKRPTLAKIRTIRKQFQAFIENWNDDNKAQLVYVHEIELEHMKAFARTWDENMPLENGRRVKMSGKTKQKRIGYLKNYFDHAIQAQWREDTGETVPKGKHSIRKSNPANLLESTGRGSKAQEKQPFTDRLYDALLKACLQYQRLAAARDKKSTIGIRAHVLFELMHNTGFSISDAVLCRRWRLKKQRGEYYFDMNRKKLEGSDASKSIWMKVEAGFAERLLNVPTADSHPEYFFWSKRGEEDNAADSWWRLFPKVLELVDQKILREDCGVSEGEIIMPTYHCFRYTFAQNLFAAGADVPEVATLMGDTPEVVFKHYYKFSKKLQAKSDELMQRVWEQQAERRIAPGLRLPRVPEGPVAQA